MPFVELTLGSLEELDDGRVSIAFGQAMRAAVQDCVDRPAEKKVRTVTLELKLKPIIDTDDGITEMKGASGEFTIKSKVPERRSKTYEMRANKKGQLAFSSNSPENMDQATFDDVDPKTGRVDRRPK